MALDFPASPTLNQVFTAPNGSIWVWDSAKWTASGVSTAFLPLAGGTLTGGLTIAPPTSSASVVLNPTGVQNSIVDGQRGGLLRWRLFLPTNATESGGNVGSDLWIQRFADSGAAIDTPLTITRSTGVVTMAGGIAGVIGTSAAAAGLVGEVISSVVTSPVTLTTGVTANVGSISLTAGDWDVQGEVWILFGTTAGTAVAAAINSVSATLPAAVALGTSRSQFSGMNYNASNNACVPLSPCRVSLSATTTYYLVANAAFAGGTTTATGKIWARRAR